MTNFEWAYAACVRSLRQKKAGKHDWPLAEIVRMFAGEYDLDTIEARRLLTKMESLT